MKIRCNAYIIENNSIKEVEVLKITSDFVTVRYKTLIPDGKFGSIENNGGLRLRKNKVYKTKNDAEKYLKK